MNDIELAALTAAVAWQTAIVNYEVHHYGSVQTDPNTPEVSALHVELERRGLTPDPKKKGTNERD